MNVHRYLMVGAITVVMALLPVSTASSQERVQISTYLTPLQLEGLGAAARQMRDEIPSFAYQIMGDPSCIVTLTVGVERARWDTDITALNRAMHETGCFDPYTFVHLVTGGRMDWPDPLLIERPDPATLYVKIDHFFFDRGDIATKFLSLGLIGLEGIERVVLDLRGSPGGRIDAGMDLLGFFPPLSAPLQRQTARELHNWPIQTHLEQFSPALELVILVDHGTASIAEVVTGVLTATYPDALVVGERTFGKGLTQGILDGGPLEMIYTTGEFILPGGVRIQGQGIAPTIPDEIILACVNLLCIFDRIEAFEPTTAALAARQ